MSGAAFHDAAEKVVVKAKRIAAHALQGGGRGREIRGRHLLVAKDQPTLTMKEVARDAANPAKVPKDMEGGLAATAVIRGERENFPNGCHICEVEIDPETGKRRDRALQRGRRRRHRAQSDAAVRADPRRRRAGHRADPQGGHPLRSRVRPAADRLVHGLRDAARARLLRRSMCIAIRCRPRPTRSAPRARARPARVGAMPAVANALVDALSEFGVKHIEMPATPEVVWRAMRQ